MNQQEEFRYSRYFCRLYANRNRLKRKVLRMERHVARSVVNYFESRNSCTTITTTLPIDLEWLLTWKLKTGCAQEIMWCDGVEKLMVKPIGQYRIRFKAQVRVGPENGTMNTSVSNMFGEIEIKHTGKQLKNYWIVIKYKNKDIVARKNIKQLI